MSFNFSAISKVDNFSTFSISKFTFKSKSLEPNKPYFEIFLNFVGQKSLSSNKKKICPFEISP